MKNNYLISAEQVAQKLAALKNLQSPAFAASVAKEPRLLELAHWMQWRSRQPGGLESFPAELLSMFRDRLGTSVMLKIAKTDDPYTPAERQEVIADFPRYWTIDQYNYGYSPSDAEKQCISIMETFNLQIRAESPSDLLRSHPRPDLAFVNKQNHSYFFDVCRRLAQADLPWRICQWCQKPDACFENPFYFPDLQNVLLELMDAQSGLAADTVAPTAVKTMIDDAVEFAWNERTMVEITGDSRFGKTVVIEALCKACPGRYRLVKVPYDSTERSLLEAIADAAGCDYTYETPQRELKAKVQFILKYSGLLWIFDEAAWLLPTRYTSRTTPMRLNFIRSQMLDNGCPVVLVITPQFNDRASKKFQDVTGFNLAQWNGRIMRKVSLPSVLPREDLAAVVKIHFPELTDEKCVDRLVGAAMSSQSFLFAVEAITKNSRAVARKRGHAEILRDDLDEGIILSGLRQDDATRNLVAPRRASHAPARPAAPRQTRPLQPLAAPSRSVTPKIETQLA